VLAKSAADADAAAPAASATSALDAEVRYFQLLIEMLSGRAVRIATIASDASATGEPADGAPAASPAPSLQIAVSQRTSEHYSEAEASAFAAEATVQTADGREMRLELSLLMQRRFESTTSVTVSSGERKDPLLLNLAGNAPELGAVKHHFDLDADGAFTVFFETDTYQQVSFGGRYTHANGVIRLVALNNNILPLDESSTRIVPHLGLVGEFETPAMTCGAVAHGYNDPARAGWKSYGCPLIHRGPESDEENAFEFDDASSPFAYTFTGGVFRQRDVNVYRAGSPTVWRGYGIYRRVGDRFYADFGGQFPDHNLLKGRFENGDAQIVVDQLEPGAGACGRR